jgi:hypothetical protein
MFESRVLREEVGEKYIINNFITSTVHQILGT